MHLWNMGPVVPPINRKTWDLNGEHVIIDETVFIHDKNQKCGKWFPNMRIGSEPFPEYSVEVYTDMNEVSEKGPYSDLSMALVYTCNHLKCSIYCSCKICQSIKPENCKLICKNFSCPKCIPQCPKHKIGLDRVFNIKTHCYSIIADSELCIRFVVKHSGIPISCKDCRSDLMDHLTLHKIYHTHCKFCRQILAPFDYYHVVTTEDYTLALEKIAFRAKITCAICLKMFMTPKSRRRHEKSIHEKAQTYQCDDCDKKFCNRKDLTYHYETEHQKNEPEICKTCNKEFKTKVTLRIHQTRLHNNQSDLTFHCDDCGENFGHKSSLLRHQKEKHLELNIDWRLVQLQNDLTFKCDICSKHFTRKSSMDEHKRKVHEHLAIQNKCSYCSKEFSKLFNCKRHEKQCKKNNGNFEQDPDQ